MKKNKRIGAVLACVMAVGMLAAACGGNKGIQLPHYDQSADQNYNSDLFYRNDMTTYSADPSVIWVPEERDERYGGYFYMFSTDNVESFGVHRSRDLINWEYVQAAFAAKKGSWAQNRMYAPECYYDDNDKLYYLFFSASWDGRENDSLYNSYAEKKEYERIEKEVAGYDFETARNKIDEYRSIFSGETAADGYTDAQRAAAKRILDDYDRLLEESGAAASENELLLWTRDCALRIGTVKIERKTSVDYVHSIGVAVSDSPVGPFYQYTNIKDAEFLPGKGYDENARDIDIGTPFLAHEDFYTALTKLQNTDPEKAEALAAVLPERLTMIDVNPFVDPQTGDKYIYFSSVQPRQEYIFGMKMGEKWTDDPQWETLTPLTRYGYATINREEIDYPKGDEHIEEGPHMLYDEQTKSYYLTFSVNGSFNKEYAVGQAVSDSPLGSFTKVPMSEGGLVIAADMLWDHVSGPGHHCFLTWNGKTYIFYQGLYERQTPSTMTRGICVDELKSFVNDKGLKVFNANGPTYAPMPKIGPDAEYSNIAETAEITVTGGEKKEALNDGLIRIMTHHDLIPEFSAPKGKTTITLDFDEYRAVRAIMVFNARDIENWFDKIDRIELDFVTTKDGKEIKDTAYMKDLAFNKELYTFEMMNVSRPGGSVCAEFTEINVKTIRITIDSDKPFSVSEIFVLGK